MKRENVVAALRNMLGPDFGVEEDAVDRVMDVVDEYVERELALEALHWAEEFTLKASGYVKATRDARRVAEADSLARAQARSGTSQVPIYDGQTDTVIATVEVPT